MSVRLKDITRKLRGPNSLSILGHSMVTIFRAHIRHYVGEIIVFQKRKKKMGRRRSSVQCQCHYTYPTIEIKVGVGGIVKISVCFQHGWTRHDMGDNAMNENSAHNGHIYFRLTFEPSLCQRAGNSNSSSSLLFV